MTTPVPSNKKSFSISQIKAYIPITLDMTKLNYQAWRELFETHCTCFGVLGHLDGTSSSTPETARTWKEHDGLVKMWIYGTIFESILDTVLKTKASARELWLSIEGMFRDNKEARALELKNKLRTIVISDLTVHTYCQKLKTISDLLANLHSPVSDQALVLHLLNGLSDKLDNILNVIKHKSPFPTFLEARSILTMEEKRLSKQTPSTLVTNNNASTPSLLLTTSDQQHQHHPPSSNTNFGSNNTGYGGYGSNNTGYNNRGRRRGHGGRNNRGRGRSDTNWPPLYYSPPWQIGGSPWPSSYFPPTTMMYSNPNHCMGSHQQVQAHNNNALQPSLLGPAPSRPNHEAHLLHVVPSSSSSSFLPTNITHAFNTMSLVDPYNSPWIMDSGATNHITSNLGTLRSTFNSSSLPSITVRNGSLAPVTTISHGIVPSYSRNFHLRNVLVCPSIIKNLISVRKFVTDNFSSLEFDPFGFTVKDLPTRTPLLRCNSSGPLYSFTPSSQVSHPKDFTVSDSTSLFGITDLVTPTTKFFDKFFLLFLFLAIRLT
ncbi:PREDICTED: uncharacterized protein LOC109127243 [Camelina sativa]|uniref:Uncharacterized protein LOC109127243 n=1 Tax=Camelina sativa TaxID=90675 RepID=A0ABM1QKQ1_CAMSA|nr:PREDICTED: uncharacterized protein LOC109127243 [Camelina sativa]